MADFRTQNVRQVYVARKLAGELDAFSAGFDPSASLTDPGDFGWSSLAEDNTFSFYGLSATGEAVRSDIIDAALIKSMTYLKAEDDMYLLKSVKISLNPDCNGGQPLPGQNYLLNVNFRGFLGFGDENTYHKTAMVHANPSSTAASLMTALGINLYINCTNDPVRLVNVYVGGTEITQAVLATYRKDRKDLGEYIVVEEAEQAWARGLKDGRPVPFYVNGSAVIADGDGMLWAKIERGGLENRISNTTRIADLEYSAHGERGDIYRGMGWPRVIPTQYLVPADGSDKDGYNVLTLHYQYGRNDSLAPGLSVKDIQIVSTEDLSELKSAIEGYIATASSRHGTTVPHE